MRRITAVLMVIVGVALSAIIISPAKTNARVRVSADASPIANPQSGCPAIFPAGPVAVAPNQPSVPDQSTVGIINALCDVTLDFIGCGFLPASVTLGCDSNGDGVSDLSIPLKNITVINGLFFQATIPALATSPGTAFPLACCGGVTTITLSRTVGAGDDNAFGQFTQTVTCPIDLGIRAPVVISATPSEADCSQGQNVLIPGSCFLLAGGKPNVTSVFAVEIGNPNNVIQASPIAILSNNLIDAFFQIGTANAGKTFLIYATGPNGTSRNLTVLPASAPAGCPLGNEQGVPVILKCKGNHNDPSPSPGLPTFTSCVLDRDATGAFTLSLGSNGIPDSAVITIGGISAKKTKFRNPDPTVPNLFHTVILKGRVCQQLPGAVVATVPGKPEFSVPFFCAASCSASQ